MTLKQSLALALVLIPAAGRAGCETEAVKAREMIMASGSFQYSGKYIKHNCESATHGRTVQLKCQFINQQNGQYEQQLSGLIEPLRAHHILNEHTTMLYGHTQVPFHVLEEITIGHQTWLRGEIGWYQPTTASGQPDIIAVLTGRFFLTERLQPVYSGYVNYIVSAKCLGEVEIEENKRVGYELQYNTYREQVFVEPATGLTVRFEQIRPDDYFAINFRYDAPAKIEPPKVEANAPEAPVPSFAATKF